MELPPIITVRPSDRNAGRGPAPGQPTTGYLRYWTPLLGPTASLAYRHLVDATNDGAKYGQLDLLHLAIDLGVSRRIGPNSTICRSLRRLDGFGLFHLDPGHPGQVNVAVHLPWLTREQLDRLRPELAHLESLWRRAA